jgi:hypothetical protein
MKDKTRQEAVDKILIVMCNYYTQGLTQEVLDLYHLLWADYEVSEISAASMIWMKNNRWFPKADEIIKIIESARGPQIDIKTRALEQWRVVLQQLQYHGSYHPPKFSDPITAHLLKNQFRWSYLSEMKVDEEQWEQKRWIEAFEAAAKVHQDLLEIGVSGKVMELISEIPKSIDALELAGETVPKDKITAFRQMLEAQAHQDEKDLEKTNKRLRVQKGEV